MVVETTIWKSLETIVCSLDMSIVCHNQVVDSLGDCMGGNHRTSVGSSSAFWKFLVLVVEMALNLSLLSLCELLDLIIIIGVVLAVFGQVDKAVSLTWSCHL